jgi:hypothetical protein
MQDILVDIFQPVFRKDEETDQLDWLPPRGILIPSVMSSNVTTRSIHVRERLVPCPCLQKTASSQIERARFNRESHRLQFASGERFDFEP